jgi:phage shock protein PspC (stress-responsive transcriptional regulator)
MKKNFSVNIGSRIFNIDEDAYERLNNYLVRLRTFFASDEGCDEILSDIEMRISELLEQKKSGDSGIISLHHINDVIVNMGEPDELSGTKQKTVKEKTPGKLYRDPDNRQIGGVCAGIAAWLGVAPLWVRVALILITLFYGTGVIIYLILWLILPEAKTTSEKLEMQRQTINIGTLRDELASAGSGLKNTGHSVMHTIGTFLRLCTEIIARLVKWIFKLLRWSTGALILIIVLIIFASISLIFLIREPYEFGIYHLGPAALSNTFEWLLPSVAIRWQAYMAASLLLIGTLGILIFVGLRLMLKWPPVRWLVISLLSFMIFAGLIVSGSSILQYSRTTNKMASESQRQTIGFSNKQLQLSLGSFDRSQYWMPLTEKGQSGRFNDVLGDISLSVRPAPADTIIITTVKTASAVFESEAAGFAKNITNTYNFKDSSLMVNPYFRIPLKDGMHYQKAEVIIGIPINTEVNIDGKMCQYIHYTDFIDEKNDGGIYLMTSSGLQLLSKKEIPWNE